MGTSERLLAGRYQLIEEIGHDDLTDVFRAVDVRDEGHTVAVKILRDVYREFPEITSRFLELATAAEVLRGPHIVDVYRAGEDRGLHYAVMEWVEGVTLRRMLDEHVIGGRQVPLDAPEAGRIAVQIASALEDAHSLGLVHGGLEPKQVLINTAGRVQVSDFGLCRVLAPPAPGEAPLSATANTGPYLAPEQVRGQEPDLRCDLFSLGALLLEMIAGAQARDALAAWRLGRSPGAEPVLPRTYVPQIPAMLESIILRALRFNPDERYGSAVEMRDDLEAFLESYARRTVGYQPAAPPVPRDTPVIPVVTAAPVVRVRRQRPAGWPDIYWPWLAAAIIALFVVCALLLATANFLGIGPLSSQRATVPNVVGLPVQQAERSLRLAGFNPSVTYQDAPDQVPNNVLSQTPAADTQAVRGSTVRLVAVQPPPTSAPLVEVPNVVGQSQEGARLLIEASGFKLGVVTTRLDPAVAAGVVLEQNPRAQLALPPGSNIDIVVNQGAPPPVVTPLPPVPPTAATVCLGDERLAFNPPVPVLNQPVLIDAYSARPHRGVALTGPGAPVFVVLRQEGAVYHWQWQAVPTLVGHYEYQFSVQNGVVCARATFDIANPGGSAPTTIPVSSTNTPVPAVPTPPGAPGSGVFLMAWGSNGTGNGQFRDPTGVAVYGGVVYVVDAADHRVERFDLNGTYLGAFGQYGSAPGQFNHPEDIAVRADGTLIVADTNNHRIQILDTAGNVLGQLGQQGSDPGMFLRPHGVAVDQQGRLYVADTNNHRVQVFEPAGRFLFEFGGLGPGPGQFNFPVDLAVDAAGSIYVVDGDNYRIQQFSNTGTVIRAWGGFGSDPGRFTGPVGLALDAQSNVYVADSGNHRVQEFDSRGEFLLAWGTAGSGPGQFLNPHSVAVGQDGLIYVVDSGNSRVQKFR